MKLKEYFLGFLVCLPIFLFGINNNDSIRNFFNNTNSDSLKIISGLELGDLNYESEPDTALFYYLKVLNFTQQKLKQNQSPFIVKKYAEALYSSGYIYNGQGNIKKALEYYYKSLKIRESINDTSGIAYSLLVIGNVFLSQGDFKKALESFIKCEKLFQLTNDNRGLSIIYNNLGYCYSYFQKNELAINYFKKCLELNNQNNDLTAIATSTNNIGMMYFNSKKYKEAIQYFEEAIEIIKQKDLSSCSIYLKNLGNTYLKLNNKKTAEKYFIESYTLAKQMGFPSTISSSSFALYEFYYAKNEYKKALNYFEEYVLMNDSINNETIQKASIQKQFQYEYEKKAAEDSVANAKANEIRDAQIAQQKSELKAKRNQQLALFGGVALVLVFAGFMYNRFKITQKQKLEIELAHQQLEEKNAEIIASIRYAKRIQDSLLTSQKYIERNINRLKNQTH
ncbi:MAG TPA: tetratricopeptide repeat protein [Vicingus sp.]|nr:tetratricopeptide repeat protein [Vicingus sp.]HRP59609.1 tetratricopeptide repeat protein [Vicingus sp.]